MFYRLVYNITTSNQSVLRLLLLIAGVVCDFVMIFYIVSSIIVSTIYIVGVVISFSIGLICRLIAIYIYRRIEYIIDDEKLLVRSLYVIFSKVLIDVKFRDIEYISKEKRENVKYIDISNTESDKYYLETKDKKYICNMDDYMYAKILYEATK